MVLVDAEELLDVRRRLRRRDHLHGGAGALDPQAATLIVRCHRIDRRAYLIVLAATNARQDVDLDGLVGDEEEALQDQLEGIACWLSGHRRVLPAGSLVAPSLLNGFIRGLLILDRFVRFRRFVLLGGGVF